MPRKLEALHSKQEEIKLKRTKHELFTPESIVILTQYCCFFEVKFFKTKVVENIFIRTCDLIKYLLQLKLNDKNKHSIFI